MLTDGNDDQGSRPHTQVKALQEQVQQQDRGCPCPRLVREGHYDGLVIHGGPSQHIHQGLSSVDVAPA
jgi:hypothetical protein